MKHAYFGIILLGICLVYLSVVVYRLNNQVQDLSVQVKNLDNLAGQRISVIDSFLLNATTQNGVSVYQQYVEQLKANQK